MANKRGDGAKHSKKQADKIRKAKDDYRWADAADKLSNADFAPSNAAVT